MADSRKHSLILPGGTGMNCSGGEFKLPEGTPYKLVNMIPESGEMRLLGGREIMWNETWKPSGLNAVYDWSVPAVGGE